MRVNAPHDICHRGKNENVPLAERSRHFWKDKRLGLHAARIADQGDDRCADDAFRRNRGLRQHGFMRVPPAAGIVTVVRGRLEDGFLAPALGLAVLASAYYALAYYLITN